jgi:uncharacterized protein
VNRSFLILICLVLFGPVFFSVTGCSPVSPPVTYHSLLGSGLTNNPTGSQSRLAILVGPVSVPDVLKTSQIATGSGERYQLSDQHRWTGEVAHDFARAVGEQLAARLGTEQIALYPKDQHLEPTHQVILDILAMEGVLGKEAKLAARWSLVDPKSKTVRVTRRSIFSEPPADGSYDAWVAAQRRNLSLLSEEIAAAIKTAP